MPSTLAFIDADILVYQALYASETEVDFGDDAGSYLAGDLKQAKREFASAIDSIVAAVKAKRATLAFSDSKANFRKDIYPEYKADRAALGRRKPMNYAKLRQWVRDTYTVVQRPGLEGDDILGIMATKPRKDKARRVICSIDKDMRTVPGLHYNWSKPTLGVSPVTADEAQLAFFVQILTGDSTDNYPGVRGIGPKRASKIIQDAAADGGDARAVWEAIVAAYEHAGFDEEFALGQARCARILHAENYDRETEEVRLWQPPS